MAAPRQRLDDLMVIDDDNVQITLDNQPPRRVIRCHHCGQPGYKLARCPVKRQEDQLNHMLNLFFKSYP